MATQDKRPKTTSAVDVHDKSVEHLILKSDKQPVEKFRLDYKPPEYFIKHVELDFDLVDDETVVTTCLHMYRNKGSNHGTNLTLDGENLKLIYVKYNDTQLSRDKSDFSLDGNGNLIISGKLLPTDADEIFKIHTQVHNNPKANSQLMGLYKSKDLFCTQCEAMGFRRITYFLDRPDVMSTYKVTLKANKESCPVLISNGNKVAHGVCDDTHKHFAVFDDPFPKPCYLFALVAGNLKSIVDEFVTMSGKKVHLEIFSEPKDCHKLQWAMQSLKNAMKWDEENYGREYDLNIFNIVCVGDFNMGAMENKSLNIFNTALVLADEKTATDDNYVRIARVVAHEYFHNWTGNRVTCRDWFQLTLKEGLTVFRDSTFGREICGGSVRRIEDVSTLRSSQFSEDCGPMSHPIRPESYIAMDNFYTATVYEKGCEVIGMYKRILGADGFRKGTDLYFQRHDGQAVTCDDFRAAMADANGYDLSQFERWYSQSGTPIVSVCETKFDEKLKTLTLKFKQVTQPSAAQPHKQALHIPIAVGLIGKKSLTEIVPTTILHLKEDEQEFVIENVSEEPLASILRDFSAPVRLDYDLCDDDLALLMGYDTDDFNKWEAGQKLTKKVILALANQLYAGTPEEDLPPLSPNIIAAFQQVLNDSNLDGSFRSHTLCLPTISSLLQEMRPVDIDALFRARKKTRKDLYAGLRSDLQSMYDQLTCKISESQNFDLSTEAMGVRALRNCCLSYLCVPKDEVALKLADTHFKNATNMTDKTAGLQCLCDMYGTRERTDALESFYTDAQGDALVIDKWFAVQARADHECVIEEVHTLMQHKDFTIRNPNRLRSLVSAFSGNHSKFHKRDGAGYKLLANVVIEVDALNPQVAARMSSALISWKQHIEERQELMKAELRRIMELENISADTYEVVNKGLIST